MINNAKWTKSLGNLSWYLCWRSWSKSHKWAKMTLFVICSRQSSHFLMIVNRQPKTIPRSCLPGLFVISIMTPMLTLCLLWIPVLITPLLSLSIGVQTDFFSTEASPFTMAAWNTVPMAQGAVLWNAFSMLLH